VEKLMAKEHYLLIYSAMQLPLRLGGLLFIVTSHGYGWRQANRCCTFSQCIKNTPGSFDSLWGNQKWIHNRV